MTLLLILLIVAMLPMWAIGMLTFIQWVRPAQGIDKSNVINRLVRFFLHQEKGKL